MANPEVQVDTFGWDLDLRMVDDQGSSIDISAATTREFMAKRPSVDIPFTMAASFITDGTDGKLRHVVVVNEINVIGTWQIQSHVIMPGVELFSEILFFEVKANV